MRPLIWFRADLRVEDNPAFHDACRTATRGAIAVFVICPAQWRRHDWADVKVDFILRTLRELSSSLVKLRIPLIIRTVDDFDDVAEELLDLALKHKCDSIHFNREYEVNEARRDDDVVKAFTRAGLGALAHTDQVILAPGAVRTGSGDFYKVFTPYRKAWTARVLEGGIPHPLPAPKKQAELVADESDVPRSVEGFGRVDGLDHHWPAGAQVAMSRLRTFVKGPIRAYDDQRDHPAVAGTSALSPYLAIGAISPGQCLAEVCAVHGDDLAGGAAGPTTWISEIVWREFYRQVMVGFPRVSMHRPFKLVTDRIRWRDDEPAFQAWCEGRTGIPIIDAAMRQLLDIGWMHNRLRMITAVFLTKHLLIDWRRGERFFMRHLIDGDLASNNGGWQWSASTGTDAVPYFRIFNPYRQSERFDPDGAFIRRYVPELADVEGKAIHDPSALKDELWSSIDYPEPIVAVNEGRDRALKELTRVFKG